MKRFKHFLLLVCLNLVSCGYREGGSELENVLLGNWQLREINCYLDGASSPMEKYSALAPEIEEAEFAFEGRNFLFSAQLISPACVSNSNGMRMTDYHSVSHGLLNLFSVQSEHCLAKLDEMNNMAMDVDVPFAVNEVRSQNLEWRLNEEGELELEWPAILTGSSQSAGCASQCQCFGEFFKKSE